MDKTEENLVFEECFGARNVLVQAYIVKSWLFCSKKDLAEEFTILLQKKKKKITKHAVKRSMLCDSKAR